MDKAYIVANEQQEREVLEVLCANGMKCFWGTSSQFRPLTGLPYVIYESDNSNVLKSGRVSKINHSTEIVFDGRTEPEPVKVSKEIMEDIKEYVEGHKNQFDFLYDFSLYPIPVSKWLVEKPAERVKLLIDYIEGNRALITTEQYVIRSIDPDENGDYSYLRLGVQSTSVPDIEIAQIKLEEATHFETREEATEFLITGMEIVEV